MKNKAYNVATYGFSDQDQLLFDANVWLYLFPAPSNTQPWFAKRYSSALKQILIAKSGLRLDPLALSEYLNRYCRIEWMALHSAAYTDFKAFRKSAAFGSVGAGASLLAQKILGLCSRCDQPFGAADIAQVLADFESGAQDFNDGLLAETCRLNGWKLVTNDSDFRTGGIELLTANPKLLQACP